ncbi:hypothetical protein SCHPADRAFT_998050 [Schizopora paradoxa]|uniref:F-box domain-containing protein n=1 Tax=Schizopora paradoxa TaxID=27342 RepID=A0A0H2RL23_9AGAM|nr:hypothetical protein SCHPADRAFT_998050 [Schizopora paradoxa]
MDVLRVLEESALRTKPGEIEKISCWETWDVGRNADFQRFSSDGGHQTMDNETFARIALEACRVDSMVTTLTALLDTALDIQRSYNQCMKPFRMKYSMGLASLPDEVLLHIFRFVALSDETTRKHAVRLSHVSRKFRELVLGEHLFWVELHSSAKKDELDAFLSRSGHDTDLHVVIRVDPRPFDPMAFLDNCWHTAPRWKSLKICEHKDLDLRFTANVVLKEMDQRYNLQFQRLHKLHVDGWVEHGGIGNDNELRFKPTWSSPKLRILRCLNFIPLPSTSYSSLSSFATSLLFSGRLNDKLRDLSILLSSTPTITKLELAITFVHDDGLEVLEPFKFENVKIFRFLFPSHTIGTFNNDLVLKIMKTLHLPNLEHFYFSIRPVAAFLPRDEDASSAIIAELARVFVPDPFLHPKLTSLSLTLTCVGKLPTQKVQNSQRASNILPWTFKVPLDQIPYAASLSFTTFAQIIFTWDGASSPGSTSSLRRLRFSACKKLTSAGLRETIRSLKDAGAWNTLERIVVENCNALKYDETLKEISEDKITILGV